jgi:hypothetical protein
MIDVIEHSMAFVAHRVTEGSHSLAYHNTRNTRTVRVCVGLSVCAAASHLQSSLPALGSGAAVAARNTTASTGARCPTRLHTQHRRTPDYNYSHCRSIVVPRAQVMGKATQRTVENELR